MVRKYIRVPDGNDTPYFNGDGNPIPGRGRPIGVVLGELEGDSLVFGYSLLNPSDEYFQVKSDLTAYGRFYSGRYAISMRWTDEQIVEYLEDLGMSQRTMERIRPILFWMRDEFVRHPDKVCKMPVYFPYIVQQVSGVEMNDTEE